MTQAEYNAAKSAMFKKYKAGEITNYAYIQWKKKNDPSRNTGTDGSAGGDAGTKDTDNAIDDVEKRLEKVYKQVQREIRAKLKDWKVKHQEKDEKMLAKLRAGEITQDEYIAWKRNALATGDLWKQKLDQVSGVLLDANQQAMRIINGEKMNVFAENANFQSYQLEQNAGMDLSFAIYDADAVGNLIKNEPELLPRKVVDGKKDKAWNQKKMANALAQGIIQGESIPKLAARIARDTASENMSAMTRYARTAMTGAQNAGRMMMLERAKGMGIKVKKKWLCTLDARTRDAHRNLDGQTVDVEKPFKSDLGDIMYPGDPSAAPGNVYNCRCTLIYEYDGFPAQNDERRDQTTGEVIPNMTYNQWKNWKNGGGSGGTGTGGTGSTGTKDKTGAKGMNPKRMTEAKALEYYVEHGREWLDSLTEEERKAVELYGLNDLSAEANGYLRGQDDQWQPWQEEDIKKRIKVLDKAINKGTLGEDMYLYRGVGKDFLGLDFTNPDALIGQTITDGGYMSTSGSLGVAEVYGRGVVLEIKVPKGTHAAFADLAGTDPDTLLEWYREDGDAGNIEYLLQRGGQLKFTGYSIATDSEGKQYLKMEVEYIPPEQTAKKSKTAKKDKQEKQEEPKPVEKAPESKKELTPVEKIRETVEKHKGKKWTLDEVQKVGKEVVREVGKNAKNPNEQRKEIMAKQDVLYKERDEISRRASEINQQLKETVNPARKKELRKELEEIRARKREISAEQDKLSKEYWDVKDGRQAAFKEILAQIREVGGVTEDNVELIANLRMYEDKTGKTKKATIEAMNNYPAEWLLKSAQYKVALKPHWTTERAYYNPSDGEIRFRESESTNVHEMGHRFESCVPGILESEREFYAKRTKGEKLEWMGPGYRQNEKTRKDKFENPYMGKDYGGYAFELVSMGFQYVFTDYERLASDPDMESWILGLLVTM